MASMELKKQNYSPKSRAVFSRVVDDCECEGWWKFSKPRRNTQLAKMVLNRNNNKMNSNNNNNNNIKNKNNNNRKFEVPKKTEKAAKKRVCFDEEGGRGGGVVKKINGGGVVEEKRSEDDNGQSEIGNREVGGNIKTDGNEIEGISEEVMPEELEGNVVDNTDNNQSNTDNNQSNTDYNQSNTDNNQSNTDNNQSNTDNNQSNTVNNQSNTDNNQSYTDNNQSNTDNNQSDTDNNQANNSTNTNTETAGDNSEKYEDAIGANAINDDVLKSEQIINKINYQNSMNAHYNNDDNISATASPITATPTTATKSPGWPNAIFSDFEQPKFLNVFEASEPWYLFGDEIVKESVAVSSNARFGSEEDIVEKENLFGNTSGVFNVVKRVAHPQAHHHDDLALLKNQYYMQTLKSENMISDNNTHSKFDNNNINETNNNYNKTQNILKEVNIDGDEVECLDSSKIEKINGSENNEWAENKIWDDGWKERKVKEEIIKPDSVDNTGKKKRKKWIKNKEKENKKIEIEKINWVNNGEKKDGNEKKGLECGVNGRRIFVDESEEWYTHEHNDPDLNQCIFLGDETPDFIQEDNGVFVSNEEDNNERIKDGRMKDERIKDGRMKDGRMKDERMKDERMNERMTDERRKDERMKDGRMKDGRMTDERMKDGRMKDGRMTDKRMKDGLIMNERMNDGRMTDKRMKDGLIMDERMNDERMNDGLIKDERWDDEIISSNNFIQKKTHNENNNNHNNDNKNNNINKDNKTRDNKYIMNNHNKNKNNNNTNNKNSNNNTKNNNNTNNNTNTTNNTNNNTTNNNTNNTTNNTNNNNIQRDDRVYMDAEMLAQRQRMESDNWFDQESNLRWPYHQSPVYLGSPEVQRNRHKNQGDQMKGIMSPRSLKF